MQRHFHEELKQLKNKLLEMSFAVEEAVAKACEALFTRSATLAESVIAGEKRINNYEIEIDEEGHALFALGQPMAVDLRLITMILKINTDIERMGDHAVNIAEKCLYILDEPPLKIDERFEKMAAAAQKMLRDALGAFLKEDTDLALSVLKRDDEVDDYNAALYCELNNLMEENSKTVTAGMNLLMISHNIERIADLANNIAEDVIYWKQGREVRHRIHMDKPSAGM
ncbi:MAG: phosphate transport system regulatory protein PhoU [Omnitrophica bacterium GWA2_52_8]|nr:MAG: phosphate transport system regulatory protein PhoU [Omnitrophica bacterium GWA2_52_8]